VTPENWARVKELFSAAVDMNPEDRKALLRRECGDDGAVLGEVESLLAMYDSDPSTPGAPLRAESSASEPARIPDHIGRYRIVRQIGQGGMGAVYLALRNDQEYEKRVAIKLVKAGFGAEALLSRFRHERQILATLDHANIAKLLDGGTTDEGLPYLVMDYVDGVRIDEYCDRGHLSVRRRVDLFVSVCAAVQYVHQNLVVHRDLKPNNILVTSDGVPKLLDFGIAKLLKPETFPHPVDATRAGVVIMTPRYASPEQVRGEPVTTATDVYALGVILYELLTAHQPYDLKTESPADIVRAICEEEPQNPSTVIARPPEDRKAPALKPLTPDRVARLRGTVPARLARQLRGDLDAVVLKALRKEPQHRYTSVEQFSEDLRRYLGRRPVRAHADSWIYRTRKFVGRHRAGAAAAALVLLSLVGGVLGTSWQARIARAERARAERRFNDVRRLSTSFLFEFHTAIENLPGSTPARQLLVQRALEYLQKLTEEAHDDRRLQREVVEAYLKVGDVQGNPYRSNLGDLRGAEASYSAALGISKTLVDADPHDRDAAHYLARSYRSLAEVAPQLGNPSGAIQDFRQAAALLESLAAAEPAESGLRQELADCYQLLGDLQGHAGLQNLGDQAAALESYRRALAIYQRLASNDARNSAARRGVALLQIRIGDMLEFRDDLDGAFAAYRDALDMSERIAADDPTNVEDQRRLALAYRKVGGIQEDFRQYREALDGYDKAATINRALMNADPANARASMSYVISLRWTGDLLAIMGDTAGALTKYRAILQILGRLYAAEPANVTVSGRYSEMLVQTGRIVAARGDLQEARSLTARGLAIERELADRSDVTPDDLSQYARDFLTSEPGDLREPSRALRYAEASVARSSAPDSDNLDILAKALFENHRLDEAIEAENKALSLLAAPTGRQLARRDRFESELARFKAARHTTPQ
jgi:non-specific serine/threonine protein kinase/serine/threonine-protein kinase